MLFDSITLSEGSQFNNLTIGSGSVFPEPDLGEIFFRSDLQRMFFYTGTDWEPIITTELFAPEAGISLTNSTAENVNVVQLQLVNDLAAIENLSTVGVVKRTAADVWATGKIDLSSEVEGNLSVSNLATGQNANSTTFWRGDGTWAELGPNLSIQSGPTLPNSPVKGNLFYLETGIVGLYYYNGTSWISSGSSSGSSNSGGKIISNFVGTLSSIIGQSRYYPKSAVTIKSVYFSIGITPTSGNVSIDVKASGVSIFTVKPSIEVGQYISNEVLVNAPLTVDDWLSTDIIVNGTGSKNATIVINYI